MKCETKFACIPDAVTWDPELSSDAVRLYNALASFTAKASAECFPRQDKIAEQLHWHPSKVCRAIRELETRGYVASKRRGHGLDYQLSELPAMQRLAASASPLAAGAIPPSIEKTPLAAGAIPDLLPAQSETVDSSKRTKTNELEPRSITAPSRSNEKNSTDVATVWAHYQKLIQPSARICPSAKIKTRLKTFCVDDLILGIDHFAADSWWMEHNSNRGGQWFFDSDTRAETFLNIEPRKESADARGSRNGAARADNGPGAQVAGSGMARGPGGKKLPKPEDYGARDPRELRSLGLIP